MIKLILVLGLLSGGTSFANTGFIDFGGGFLESLYGDIEEYRIGDEWGKKVVDEKSLPSKSEVYQRVANATARVGGATGFYLGKFNGYHVMATNHHVMPNASACRGASFPLLKVQGACEKFFGTWEEIDLSLFAIKVSDAEAEQKLAKVARNFSFYRELKQQEPLLTIGFGIAGNFVRNMVANEDSDCKVFSQNEEYRLMGDPDSLNPGTYKAWSFSNGCDVSHGDSGSAMVQRETGEVLGIIWTGKIPKDKVAQSSKTINQMIEDKSEQIWTELSYGVPAVKMEKVLEEEAAKPKFDEATRKTLLELIKH